MTKPDTEEVMKSIVLINCYFGQYPDYFNLFLDSCRSNPTINYLFFTDNEVMNAPENVIFIRTTFEEIKKKIQDAFDFKISLDAPYKLCDYKPAYGYVFANYISQYDYWGYCDVDMIFGNLRHFLTEDILGRYDKYYKLGHLTLFRNNAENNTAFMSEGVVSYKEAFTTKRIAVFDEFQGIQKIFDKLGKTTYFARDYADITAARNRFTLSDTLVEDIKSNNYTNQVFVREDGCIYRYYDIDNCTKKEEFAYIHLQKRKFDTTINADSYLITYKGFIPLNDLKIDLRCMQKYNGTDIWKEIVMRYKRVSFKIRRKISKMRLSFNEYFASSAHR